MSKQLGKADFFSPRPVPVERVDVPELGGHVYVRMLSVTERDRLDASNYAPGKDGTSEYSPVGARARFAAAVLCDERGEPLFLEDDWRQLGDKGPWGAVLSRVIRKAKRLNGMDESAVDEAEKNSASGQGSDSSSTSPGT